MSAPADIDLAAIVRAALEEGPAPLALPLPLESFIGLTLLPAWTDELAAHVVGRLSPDAPWTPRQSVARMQTDGLVVTVGTLGEVRYAISPSTETDVTRQARLRHVERSLLSILGVVRGVVASASEADRRDLAVWCDVVDLLLADPGGLLLVERVDGLGVGDGSAPDPSAPPAVSAASVLGAAEHLGDVIGGGVVDAVRRARWRLDWRLRQAVDLGILRDYHPRPAIEERLAHLVGRGDSARAVHLLGTGGVGKTMTLRYLGSPRFAEDHAVAAPAIGRVDFDHLDPSFPERRPLLLLEALATDLLGQLSGREASYHLRTFQDAATLSFEATVEEEEPTDVDDPRVVAGVDAFAQLVSAAFGADRRVLLVLDTCEELARLAAAGSMAPAVQATFRLLDRVLRSADNVRVVFAGRRPLVPDGHPSPAPFELEVVRIGGFDRDEALGYVSRHAPQLTGEQQEGLLRVAEAPDADGIVRYNPFELAAWTAWLRQEPTLDLDDLRKSGDPYVEHRIIGRAREPFVLAMLPVIAWLERFDRSMIAPALVRAGLDADATFDVLAAQEWLSVEAREDDGRPGTLELLGGLGGRMRRYFERHPDRFSVDHERLAADLEQLLAAGRLDLRGRDDALVALARVMPRRLARDVWADVERRVAEQGVWSWARQVLPRVAGDVRDRDEGQPSVLAAILATRAAALARAGPSGVAEAWRDVAREVHRIPDEDWRELLADRATCGEVAFMTSPDPLRLERVMHDRLPIGSLAAAMWSVADAARAAGFLGELPRWTRDRLSAAEDPVARAYAALIANAADPIFGDDGGELWRVADELGEAVDPVAWTDCPVPEGLAHRCRLAALLRDRLPPRSVQVDRAGVRDIDGERLASALLEYTLDNGLPSSADLDVCVADERAAWDIGRASTCWLHRQVPPLVVVLADALTQTGRPSDAQRLLLDRLDAATSLGADLASGDACFVALIRLARFVRAPELLRVLPERGVLSERAQAELDEAERVLRPAESVNTAVTPSHSPNNASSGWIGRLAALDNLRGAELRALVDPDAAQSALDTCAARLATGLDDDVAADVAVVAAALHRAQHSGRRTVVRPLGDDVVRRFEQRVVRDPLWVGWLERARTAAQAQPPTIMPPVAPTTVTPSSAPPTVAPRPDAPSVDAAPPPSTPSMVAPPDGADGPSASPPRPRREVIYRLRWTGWVAAVGTAVVGAGVWGGVLHLLGVSWRTSVIVTIAIVVLGGWSIVRGNRRGMPGSIATRRLSLTVRDDAGTLVVTGSSIDAFDRLRIRQTGVLGWLARYATTVESLPRVPEGWQTSIVAGTAGSLDLSAVRLTRGRTSTQLITVELAPSGTGAAWEQPWERWARRAVTSQRASKFLVVRVVGGWREQEWLPSLYFYAGPPELRNADTQVEGVADPETWATQRSVLHLVGRPVTTSSGWRLRVRGQGRAGPSSKTGPPADSSSAPSSSSSSSSSPSYESVRVHDDEVLVNVGRRVRGGSGGTGVVVLQAEPIDVGAGPLDRDRDGFLALCLEAAEACGRACVVIPPLDVANASKAVDVITAWSAARGRRCDPADVVLLVGELHRLVHEAQHPDPAAPVRVEDDVIAVVGLLDKR